MTTDYSKRFARARCFARANKAQPRNGSYEPYKIGPGWYFIGDSQRRFGPYISEELCASAALRQRERDDEAAY